MYCINVYYIHADVYRDCTRDTRQKKKFQKIDNYIIYILLFEIFICLCRPLYAVYA